MKGLLQRIWPVGLLLALCMLVLPSTMLAAEQKNDIYVNSVDTVGMARAANETSTIIDSGTCGENLTWTLDNAGTLTINGTGTMYDYIYSNNSSSAPWSAFCSEIKTINFENNVSGIGKYAFANCSYLACVNMIDTIETINEGAFYNCNSLKTIYIPYSVNSIKNSFGLCSALENIEVDQKNEMFCSIYGVLFDKTITKLIQYPAGKKGSYTISNNVKNIEEAAFSHCYGLTSIVIPEGIEIINDYTFNSCISLSKIEIPSSIKTIYDNVFYGCGNISDIYYTGTNTQWKNIDLGYNNESLISANIHYNSSMPSNVDNPLLLVMYLSDYQVETQQLFFNNTNLAYSLANNIEIYDVDSIDKLLGKYVLIKVDGNDIFKVVSVRPVKSKVGKLTNIVTGNGYLPVTSLYFDGNEDMSYAVVYNVVSLVSDSLLGKTLLYHYINGEINGFEVLQEKVGQLESYNSSTSKLIIDGVEYIVSDLTNTSADNINNLLQKNVKIQYDQLNHLYAIELADEQETLYGKSYIVEKVKEYTAESFYAQYKNIRDGNDSDATKYQRFTELFAYYGFLDVNEGISYVSKVAPAVNSYYALTTNETYANYLAWDWLNNTLAGKGYRAVLIADGLTFNNELNDWLNPLTWMGIKDTPGVAKYRDMLYDFMDATSLETEIVDTISLVKKLAKNATDAGKIYANNLLNELNASTSIEDLQAALQSANAKGLFQNSATEVDKDGNWIIEFTLDSDSGFGKFSKAMGYANKFLSAYKLTVDTALDLIQMDAKLSVYMQYQDFLTDIMYSKDLPWEMRLAAAKISEEIDNGAWGKIKDIAVDVLESNMQDNFWKSILDKTGYSTFSEYLSVIEITSWCIDQVTDISSLVKGATYMEGYAYLNMHYANKLRDSKAEFLSNQTPENAWKFFENYNILYQLRCKGEEATLKMFRLKEFPQGVQGGLVSIFGGYKNKEREAVVQKTLEMLENCKFIVPDNVKVPDSVKYVSKSVISCPVDVEVYAPDGTYITTLIDGKESDLVNEYGRFAVVYRVYTGTYAKIICLSQEGNYSFKVVGQDKGLVNFELATQTDNAGETYIFTNQPVEKGSIIELKTDEVINNHHYNIDINGDGVSNEANISLKSDNSQYIPLSNLNLSQSNVKLNKGDTFLLEVTTMPENATRKNVIWTTDNSDIVDVVNGKIIANSLGTARIYCVSQDNPDIIASCVVSVAENNDGNSGSGSSSGGGGSSKSNVSSISVPNISNGGISITPKNPTTGDTVTLNVVPDNGYELEQIKVTDSSGNEIKLNKAKENKYTFVMPKGKVKLDAAFIKISTTKVEETKIMPFTDIKVGDWFYNAVKFAYENNLMNGETDTLFKPNNNLNRAMLVTILYRLENSPSVSGANNFNDVVAGQWYSNAVIWASTNGIVNGYEDGTFLPMQNVSREEMAAMLMRYAKYKGYDVSKTVDLTSYVDGSTVSAWALSNMQWANGSGLIKGDENNKLNPQGSATRAEAAMILMRFIENISE